MSRLETLDVGDSEALNAGGLDDDNEAAEQRAFDVQSDEFGAFPNLRINPTAGAAVPHPSPPSVYQESRCSI